MDWSQFGLSRPAFRPAVDTAAYFPAPTHEEAFGVVAAAFARRDPVVLIDGPPGTGKSLVARRWLERLPPDVPRAVLPNVHAAKPADLLQAILFDLNQPYQGVPEQELRLAVTGQLLQTASDGRPVVLFIDEAHHLTAEAVEELRVLGNVETAGGAATFVLLVALPVLRESLRRPALDAFAQRVAARAEIVPLTAELSTSYLRHQVTAAGGDPARVLDDGAAELLAAACGGVPRVLNHAATLAFELAAANRADVVDIEAAMEAVARLGLDPGEPGEAGDSPALPHPALAGEPVRPTRSKIQPDGKPELPHHPTAGRTPKQKAARKRSA